MTGYDSRLAALRTALRRRRLDALVVTAAPNVRYLSGFTGSNAILLVSAGEATLLTDPRYEIQASRETGCEVRVCRGPLIAEAAALVKAARWRKPGFEAARIGYDAHERLRSAAGSRVTFAPVRGLIEQLRLVKSPEEIEAISASMEIASQAFEYALGHLRGGMTETELAAEIEYGMRKLGASGPAFETIVAFGERSALPHASPGDKELGPGGLILVDMGACRDGYMSDMTRVCALGRAPRGLRRMYKAVLEAHAAAADTVASGVPVADVDAAARRVLRGYGLENAFVHSTGHGLGLEIHEAPRLSIKDKATLKAGMVITIEPGVYVEGVGGIRIEDTLVVEASGGRSLTANPKQLREF